MTEFLNPTIHDSPLETLEFVAFDIETTGISAWNDRIVEIGAIRFRGDGTEIDRFERLVHPGRSIPRQVIAIHGITDEMVRRAPRECDVLPDFIEFLGDASRTVLMAHNASFDVGFLEAALQRESFGQPTHGVLDTVRFARHRARGLSSYSLRSLVRMFGIRQTTDHRGLSDAVALKQLFCLLLEKPPRLGTGAELLPHLSPEHRFQAERRRRQRPWPRRTRRQPARPAAPQPAIETSLFPWFDTLSAAVRNGAPVQLIYDGGRAAGTPRKVTPLRMVNSTPSAYLVALCDRDRIEKHYRLDRIREVSLE